MTPIPTLIVRLFLAVQLSPAAQPATAPTTVPATMPAINVTVQTPPAPVAAPTTLSESWANTRLAQIITGKQQLTWRDVTQPVFWLDTFRNLIETLVMFIPRLIGTLIFLLVFWIVYRTIRRVALRNMKQGNVDSSIRDMLATLIKWCVMGFGVVIACNQLGIPIVAMLTGVSIIGLAVGFAAQETLANFIAGIVIFLDKPFKPGDWIDISGTFGQVKRISFRSTRLLNFDGEVIVMPNTQMLANKISNHTTNPLNRITVRIGISYRSSIDDARATLLKLVDGDSRITNQPAPEVIVESCGDSSVNLQLRFWIMDESQEQRMRYQYLERAKKALDAANIEIPFPHLQLMLEKTAALDALAGHPPAA